MELLKKIRFKADDTLYILGDILDRGPHPVKTLQLIMKMPNVVCLVGNHELMALECLGFLMQEITDMSIEALDEKMLDNIVTWQYNGSKTTLDEFDLYAELSVGDKEYLLVHAGLGNFSPEKDIEDYSLHDIVWARADYGVKYFDDVYVVSGHTPTQMIDDNPRPGYIYRHNNHIAIDCGAYIPGGRLAAICLDTGEEFYAENDDRECSY